MALLVLICNARTPVIVAHTSSRDPGSFSANGLHRSPVFEHPPAPSPLHYLSGPAHSTSTSHAVQLSRLPFATLNHFNPQTNTLVRIGKCEGEGRYSNFLGTPPSRTPEKGKQRACGPFPSLLPHSLEFTLVVFIDAPQSPERTRSRTQQRLRLRSDLIVVGSSAKQHKTPSGPFAYIIPAF
jgi:hypothetical protein